MSKRKESREYVIRGPFKVPIEQPMKGWWKLPDSVIDDFFRSNSINAYKTKIGVYVFARKHGQKYTPVYVGKSTNSFMAEIFNPTNRLTYNDSIMELKGDFYVFLLMPSDVESDAEWTRDAKVVSFRREEEIDKIETFFIKHAAKVNPKLKNKYKRKDWEWHINDVVRGHKTLGRKKSPLREFRQMMGVK